jgi:hypothetical protein
MPIISPLFAELLMPADADAALPMIAAIFRHADAVVMPCC